MDKLWAKDYISNWHEQSKTLTYVLGPFEDLRKSLLLFSLFSHHMRRVFVGSIGSDYNPIRTVIFPYLTKTDLSIGLAMFCKKEDLGRQGLCIILKVG